MCLCIAIHTPGRIAACNTLSDMYALGVVDVDSVLMLLGVVRMCVGGWLCGYGEVVVCKAKYITCHTHTHTHTQSLDMSSEDADAVTKEMIKGFEDCVNEAESRVTGGQTVKNPWPIVGVCLYVMRVYIYAYVLCVYIYSSYHMICVCDCMTGRGRGCVQGG
jgi:hypothetical protein